MKKFKHSVLTRINLLLGSLSLVLAGCHTQKQVSKHNAIMVLYGVGLEDYAPVQDTSKSDSTAIVLPTDSTSLDNATKQEHPHIMVKYGVMPPKSTVSE